MSQRQENRGLSEGITLDLRRCHGLRPNSTSLATLASLVGVRCMEAPVVVAIDKTPDADGQRTRIGLCSTCFEAFLRTATPGCAEFAPVGFGLLGIDNMNEARRTGLDCVLPWPFSVPMDCESVLVLSTDKLHSTGYRLMEFIGVAHATAPGVRFVGRFVSDPDGGDCYDNFVMRSLVREHGRGALPWQCDCLQESGALHIVPPHNRLRLEAGGGMMTLIAMDEAAEREGLWHPW